MARESSSSDHRDIVALADFRKDQPEPHPPLGDSPVLLARLLLGGAFVLEAPVLRLEIAFDRRPDVLELFLGERRRQRELVHGVELIEQLALELLAAVAGVLLLQAALHRLLELVERFHAQRLGEGIVDGDRPGRLDRLRRDVEFGGLPGQVPRSCS